MSKKISRRNFLTVSGVLAAAAALSACGGSSSSVAVGSASTGEESIAGQTIEIATYLTGDILNAYKELIAGFETASGVTVQLNEYGNDYESTMKTRMASKELPDIFETHGWSLIRYKEYLTDLSDAPWADQLSAAAKGVICDTDGSFYVLMTTGTCLGTSVNMDVCEASGVDPWSIVTWADFDAACAKIKAAGYVPIANYFSSAGALANCAGSFVSYEGAMYECNEEILNGTWDWVEYQAYLDTIADYLNKGYFYDDCATFKQSDAIERTARGECAFILGIGTSFQAGVLSLNPDCHMGLIPTPASTPNGAQFCGIGEGASFGIWNGTKKRAACDAFLAYVVENSDGLNAAAGEISTLPSQTTKSAGMKMMEEMESHFPNVFYDNLWDRKYMPSGMWSIFGTGAGMFCEDHSPEGCAAVIEYLKENYVDLYEAAQA